MGTKVCSIDECEKRRLAKGMCQMHYLRVKKHGDPHYLRPTREEIGCKFDGCEKPHTRHGYCHTHGSRLDRRGTLEISDPVDNFSRYHVDSGTGCWEWTGPVFQVNGYGQFSVTYRGTAMAHRAFWISEFGPIPEGLVVDHLCRNRKCVNVDHMDLVTVSENTRRGLSSYKLRDRCKNGEHEISSPESWYEWRGGRSCLACVRAKWARAREVQKLRKTTEDAARMTAA